MPAPGVRSLLLARRALRVILAGAALGAAAPASGSAQVVEEAVLSGSVLLGEAPLASGVVVLHHMDDQGAGEVDSTRVGSDGSFTIRLPGVPNPARGDVYFASVRHAGVMYFGNFVENAAQLDSSYVIQAYDTILAPAEGAPMVALDARNIFLEPNGDVWQATDVFQLHNPEGRTVVAREGGRVWSYPLPAEARDVMTSEGEMSADVATFEGGSFVVRAALPPGERLFVVRYLLDSLDLSFPTPGATRLVDLLVREPAPPLEVVGLAPVGSIELDVGQTFRRYTAQDLTAPSVSIAPGEAEGPPPVQWIAVALALVLTAGGLLALRGRRPSPAAAPRGDARQALLMQIAQLDEEYERRGTPSESATRDYRRRRAELVQRLKSAG